MGNNENLKEFAEILFWLRSSSAVLLAFAGVAAFVGQMQLFQQNSYFPKRYLKNIKENGSKGVAFRLILLVLLLLLSAASRIGPLMFAVISLVYAFGSILSAVRKQKRSIIPLKFTARVRRNFYLIGFVLAASATLQIIFGGWQFYWFLNLTAVFAVIPQLSVLVCFALLYPVEKRITKHYIKSAKKILSAHKDLKVIGVTGSYGKTGTKNILYKMLSEKYNTFVSPKNFNTTLGVVRSVRESMPRAAQVFICEMGAKKKNDIKEICDLVHPTVGLITSVGPQHLDTFGNIETVVSTKFELKTAVDGRGGTVYCNGDNEYIKDYMKGEKGVLYGTNKGDFYASDISCSALGTTFNLHLRDESISVQTKLLGAHNVVNIVGAAAVAYDMGVTAKQLAFAISRLNQTEHRLELKRTVGGATLIDDAYNANPVGSAEACRVLARFDGMKKVIITPGLVELGEKEEEYNFNLGAVAAECADYIILVGKNRSKPLYDGVLSKNFSKEKLFVASSFNEAMSIFAPLADSNTVLLIENDLPDNYLY